MFVYFVCMYTCIFFFINKFDELRIGFCGRICCICYKVGSWDCDEIDVPWVVLSTC